ncbi:hypothetical protein Cgig2_009453 [Carnegiea gigantea]|uniref:Uncharacterized protein n=1 Tax=Carnegiea gigantea TaxID=171969 RepID=A0A9Q1K6M2_9CARY|nr:hypothetical protein Cgig2_009453 [Carnegiea gigantea]
MEGKAAHVVDQPLEANRLTLFIKGLQPTHRQHLRFAPFENFKTLKNVGMLAEEKLAREMPIKGTNNWRGKYQNRDKKDNGSTSKEVHALDHYTKYTLIGTTYTKALECLPSQCKINLIPIRPKTGNTRKSKNWDPRNAKKPLASTSQSRIPLFVRSHCRRWSCSVNRIPGIDAFQHKVGAQIKTELKEKKSQVEDALNATKVFLGGVLGGFWGAVLWL